jgi:hypothetical protein
MPNQVEPAVALSISTGLFFRGRDGLQREVGVAPYMRQEKVGTKY